ncbi:MAG: hypothetical protein P8Z35_20710 [Ignavibacteriaceae bacterium]
MKLFYFSILIIFLFFIGCSSTYKMTDYRSKEGFIKEFNNSVYERKELKIIFKNDSSIIVSNGALIKHDVLFLNDTGLSDYNSKIPMTEIKQVSYNNHLQGAIPGLFVGPVVGAILGSTGWIINFKMGGHEAYFDKSTSSLVGSLIGFSVGAVVGMIVGYSHYFIFSP